MLPFRFLAAARHVPQWEEPLEQAMFKAVAGEPRLKGRTVLLVDVSGSMDAGLSRRSEMKRNDDTFPLTVPDPKPAAWTPSASKPKAKQKARAQ